LGDTLPNAMRNTPRKAQVLHHELWGSRQHKYDWLASHGLSSTPWQTLAPTVPALLFVPRNVDALLEYERGWKVTDIFPVNSVGIVTARDALTIQFTPEAVRHTVQRFAKLPVEEARALFELGADVRDWSVAGAQLDLNNTGLKDTHIVPITYRPFDVRYTYYTGNSKGFHCMPRGEVMGHLVAGGNLALSTTRSTETGSFTHVYLVEHLTTHHTVSLKEVNYALPLWLHSTQGKPRPNIAPQFLEQLAQSLALPSEAQRHHLPHGVSAEDVLAYVYAVLHAPSYRQRYAEFLKSDFPRIPIQTIGNSPHNFAQVWQTLLPLGRELIALHLLRQVPKALQPGYPQAGDNTVEKPRHDAAKQRVYINASQYFEGVSEATWRFKVGGYQVCEKWLKDRKGRSLTLTDIEHYQQTVAALARTQQLMQAIDAATASTLWPSVGQ
jgi:predicted helicase